MRARWFVLLAAVVGLAIIGMGMATVAADDPASPVQDGWLADAHVEACAETPPDDHADPDGTTSDVVGWVDGYWYNEPIDIDADDGLTEDEVAKLAARTAARVEALRCLTFDELPEMEFMTRDEYAAEVEERLQAVDDDHWQFEEARLMTQLYAGQDTDAFDVYLEVQSAFPAAFYNYEDEFMGFIVDEPGEIEINQVTLAHELLHALQDQHFDLGGLIDAETSDESMAGRALAEGDAVLLDSMYEERCDDDEWVDQCIIPPAVSPSPPTYWGLVLDMLAAYNTPLVAETYEENGWPGVDAIFDEPPESMVEMMDPEVYGTFDVPDIDVPDASDDEWSRITINGEDAVDRVGQHGLTAMLVAPSFETQGQVQIVNLAQFQQAHAGGSFNYDVTATSGWQADNLYAYERSDGTVASVWKLAWDDASAAEFFADAYESLLLYQGASSVDGFENVYELDEGGFDNAVAIEVTGDRVWIVTAPAVDELEAVHADVTLVESPDPTPTPPPTPTSTPTPEPTPSPTPEVTPTPAPDGIPGPGILGVAVAIAGLTGYLYRRCQS